MRKKITFTSQVLLYFILITTWTVDAWVSVNVSYKLCETSFSEAIHINELDTRAYTNSTRVKTLTTHDAQNPQSFKITVGLYGCQPQCGWQFDLEVVRSNRTVSPVQPKANPYTCQGNPYVWPIDLDAITSLYTGDTPNPRYPFAFSLAMDYCRNNINIDNNTKIPNGGTRGNLDCLMLYSDQSYDPSMYFNFQNNVTSHWPFPEDRIGHPAALTMVGTLDNIFTFYKTHYQGIQFVLQDIVPNLGNYLTDLSPFYKHDSPNEATPYDFNAITKGLSDMLSRDLIQVGSLFVVSDKDDSLPLVDRNFNSLQRTVYTNEFYVQATFVAEYPIKSVSDFGHYQENINEYGQALLAGMGDVLERDDLAAFTPSVYWLKQPFYEARLLPDEFDLQNIEDHVNPFLRASLASAMVNNHGLTHCDWIDWSVCAQCCYALQEIVGESGISPGSCNPAGHYDCSSLIHYNYQCAFGGINYNNDITGYIENMVPNLDLCAVGQNGWNVNQGNCNNAGTIRCTGYPIGCDSYKCDPQANNGEYAPCSC